MQNKIVVAVKAMVVYKDRVLIIKRSDDDEIAAGRWECPGGKLEFGEGLEEALTRELKEEVGLEVSVQGLLYASTFFTDPTRQVVILSYKCRAEHDKVELSEEHSSYRWASREELRSMIDPGILADLEKNGVFDVLP